MKMINDTNVDKWLLLQITNTQKIEKHTLYPIFSVLL